MPNAMSSQANQGTRLILGLPLLCFLAFDLLKVPVQGPSPPSGPVQPEQPDKLILGKTGLCDEATKQTSGHLTLLATSKACDRSLVPMPRDNMAA